MKKGSTEKYLKQKEIELYLADKFNSLKGIKKVIDFFKNTDIDLPYKNISDIRDDAGGYAEFDIKNNKDDIITVTIYKDKNDKSINIGYKQVSTYVEGKINKEEEKLLNIAINLLTYKDDKELLEKLKNFEKEINDKHKKEELIPKAHTIILRLAELRGKSSLLVQGNNFILVDLDKQKITTIPFISRKYNELEVFDSISEGIHYALSEKNINYKSLKDVINYFMPVC